MTDKDNHDENESGFSIPTLKFGIASVDKDGNYTVEEKSVWWFLDYQARQLVIRLIFYFMLANMFFYCLPAFGVVVTGKTSLLAVGIIATLLSWFKEDSSKESFKACLIPFLFLFICFHFL